MPVFLNKFRINSAIYFSTATMQLVSGKFLKKSDDQFYRLGVRPEIYDNPSGESDSVRILPVKNPTQTILTKQRVGVYDENDAAKAEIKKFNLPTWVGEAECTLKWKEIVDELKNKLRRLENDSKYIKEDIEKQKVKINRLTEENSATKQREEEMRTQNAKLRSKIDGLKSARDKLEERLREEQESNQKLMEKQESHQKLMDDKEEELRSMSARCESEMQINRELYNTYQPFFEKLNNVEGDGEKRSQGFDKPGSKYSFASLNQCCKKRRLN